MIYDIENCIKQMQDGIKAKSYPPSVQICRQYLEGMQIRLGLFDVILAAGHNLQAVFSWYCVKFYLIWKSRIWGHCHRIGTQCIEGLG